MSPLPVVSGRELVKLFVKLGYAVDRQRGSHIILRHCEPPHRRLVVPDHAEIANGTLRTLLRESGLSVEDLRRLL